MISYEVCFESARSSTLAQIIVETFREDKMILIANGMHLFGSVPVNVENREVTVTF